MENGAIEHPWAGIFSSRREGRWKLNCKGFRERMGRYKSGRKQKACRLIVFMVSYGLLGP